MLSVHREVSGVYVKGMHPALTDLCERASCYRVYVNFSRSTRSATKLRRPARPVVKRVCRAMVQCWARRDSGAKLRLPSWRTMWIVFSSQPAVVARILHPSHDHSIDAERLDSGYPERLYGPSALARSVQNHWPYKVSRPPTLVLC